MKGLFFFFLTLKSLCKTVLRKNIIDAFYAPKCSTEHFQILVHFEASKIQYRMDLNITL